MMLWPRLTFARLHGEAVGHCCDAGQMPLNKPAHHLTSLPPETSPRPNPPAGATPMYTCSRCAGAAGIPTPRCQGKACVNWRSTGALGGPRVGETAGPKLGPGRGPARPEKGAEGKGRRIRRRRRRGNKGVLSPDATSTYTYSSVVPGGGH
jgi:hypothetical protein